MQDTIIYLDPASPMNLQNQMRQKPVDVGVRTYSMRSENSHARHAFNVLRKPKLAECD